MVMKEIYAKASQVLVWLGEADRTSQTAFETIRQFSASNSYLEGSAAYKAVWDTVEERRIAIRSLLQRSYFSRVWVIQEAVVATHVIALCGSLSVTFDQLYSAVEKMTGCGVYHFSTPTTNVTYVGDWRSHFRQATLLNGGEVDLRLFLDSRDRNATNLRDKI
jgi:Heterokaryon incompatibility protein (HET)